MGGGGGSRPAKVFLAPLSSVSELASTVPANGDLNPYGIAVVPASIGKLHAGRLLISNFNDKANEQGTGSTIVEVAPSGRRSLFAAIKAHSLPGRCPGGVGLTTALGLLPHGYVVVGSLPTANGKAATAKAGCLIVLNSKGSAVETIAGPKIQGPWDMTVASKGSGSTLFVSNVLGGSDKRAMGTAKAGGTFEGTVVRIGLITRAGAPPRVASERLIADAIPSRPSQEALVVGPTGLALSHDGTLYLADTAANRITAISNAMTRTRPAHRGGRTVSAGGLLMGPLGLAIARGGDILTTNAGDGNIVETTPSGGQLLARTVDAKTGAGSLFGLTVAQGGKGVYFVDDGENTVKLLHK